MIARAHLAVILGLALAACGSKGPGAETPKAAPPGTKYKDMDHEQRAVFMKEVVLPKTKEIFVAFDPKFATMDCVTCHGDSVADGTFKMPNPKITPLPNSEDGFMAWMGKDPKIGKWAGFMSQQVEPLMGKLLDETVFDPKTKVGEMSCKSCHTLVAAPPVATSPTP